MKKIIALLLALMMLATALTACGDAKDKDSEKTDETTAATAEKDEGKTEDEEEDEKSEKPGVLPEKLTATKVGSFDVDYLWSVDECGIRYQDENDVFGTLTLDGKKNSGAKWTDCRTTGIDYEYYAVTTSTNTEYDEIADLNCYGLANAEGELLIPEKYASFDVLNERYVRVYEVTEQAEGKDDALVYMSNSDWSFLPDEDDAYFKGNWYVYDLEAGALVAGVSGTKPYYVFARGDVIEYYDDNYDTQYVDANGKEWKHTWFIDEDRGIYGINDEEKGEATVYDKDGKKLFTYDSEKYDMGSASEELFGDYFKVYGDKDDELVTYLMDDSGKIVSSAFENIEGTEGNFIDARGVGVCDFDGNVIYATEDYINLYDDGIYGAVFSFESDDKLVVLDKDGNIIVEDAEAEINAYSCIYKEIDGETLYYCYADKDYTIKATYIIGAEFVAKVKQESDEYTGLYDVVDVISGEVIIEGYTDYDASGLLYFEDGSIGYYIYAEKAEGGYDIYEIK